MNFRTVLIRLKPSEEIELGTICAMNIIDLMMQILPEHEPHDVPWFESFSYFEPRDMDSEYMEQESVKGKGAFIQALWTQCAIPKLYGLVYKAWRRYGAQNLTTWTRLAQAVLDECFGQKLPDSIIQVPDSCSICLSTMHWAEKTQCGHTFHLRCLLRHLDTDHQIGTSVHAPQRPMVTCIMMGTVVPGPHGLLCFRVCFKFEDYLTLGIPLRRVSVQHLLDQCRHRTTIVFGNLCRWLDRVTYYESEYPYTIFFEPNFGVHVPRSFGKTVIVFTSHLDLTWDKGVELRFFQVGRPPSHRVWEAYQPRTTDAYILDFTDCPRVADVYVKWLTWLDDWEMHRDENLPWRVVCPQPWKRALETHVERSHQNALAHGMPSDVFEPM
ncbi:uncharacterized protein TNCV_2628211 [Trichonephila clavipes]|nr:uncharacterized protein TNCV_2628211 [Trichonephila clavipes]